MRVEALRQIHDDAWILKLHKTIKATISSMYWGVSKCWSWGNFAHVLIRAPYRHQTEGEGLGAGEFAYVPRPADRLLDDVTIVGVEPARILRSFQKIKKRTTPFGLKLRSLIFDYLGVKASHQLWYQFK